MPLPPPSPSSTCVVTGASSGIGAHIARELARRGHGVTLVARREDRLSALADELRSLHGVRAEPLGCDVADPDARGRMASALHERGLDVEVLVNNAGIGSLGLFQTLDAESEVGIVRLNVEAVVALCGLWVPGMVARGRGGVLNVASTAAFQPLPPQATYGASKAFVLSFTEALGAGLHGTGVTATALCPGPVATEFFDAAGVEGDPLAGLPKRLLVPPAEVARVGVEGLAQGRRAVIPGRANAVSAVGGRLMPRSLLLPLLRRFYPF